MLVAERPRSVDVVWGLLTAAFTAAVVRGVLGGPEGVETALVYGLFPVLVAGSVAGWVWFRRHPARLEVTPAAIAFSHRGHGEVTRLLRTDGDLRIRTTYLGATDAQHWLTATGSEEAIAIITFDRRELVGACRAMGWQFVDDGQPGGS